jgi:hypothetical protein
METKRLSDLADTLSDLSKFNQEVATGIPDGWVAGYHAGRAGAYEQAAKFLREEILPVVRGL